jgi:heme exporter protein C
MKKGNTLDLVSKVLDIILIALVPFGLYMAFIYAPVAAGLGPNQKIFYFHVASAWVAFFAFFVTFCASIAYLIKDNFCFDDIAESSAGIGLLFCTIVLTTGPIWGKAAWGAWWTWDPRLTTTAILWFIYVGYLMLRKFIDEPGKRARFSAAVGIIGFIDVPIVFFSIQIWNNTIHPNVVQKGGGGLHPLMLHAMLTALLIFTLLYFSLMLKSVRLAKLKRKLDAIERQD